MPDLRKDIRELARALKDEWRAERLEWIDRTLRMLLFLNAGGAALTATYIVAVIQTEVPNLAVRALVSFLAGIASLFIYTVLRADHADRQIKRIDAALEYQDDDKARRKMRQVPFPREVQPTWHWGAIFVAFVAALIGTVFAIQSLYPPAE